jgi:hypothetical protein
MRKQSEHLEPSLEEVTGGFEGHVRPRRVGKELEYLQYAQEALCFH